MPHSNEERARVACGMAPLPTDGLSATQYPTPQEIMQQIPYPEADVLSVVRTWKREEFNGKWGAAAEDARLAACERLAHAVCQAGNRTVRVVRNGEYYSAWPSGDIITFGPKASIISTLHECGHILRGPSELEACRFSVALFLAAFPKQFERLEWRGHMLVQVAQQPAQPTAATAEAAAQQPPVAPQAAPGEES